MDREALAGLLDRVKAAAGADRELDLAIATALVPDVLVMRQRDDDTGADPHTYWQYTGSVDDSLALMKRKLGEHWLWELREGIEFRCILWTLETDYDDEHTAPAGYSASGASLAILAATLTALLAQESK